VYHVTCRGNERREIFKDDNDRKRFLQILLKSLASYTVKLYSYVLMSNHFHLLLETPTGNLGEFMRHFNITYTGYYNRRHNRSGHLYQGRYKSILVDKDTYLSVLSRYIHLNPVKIKSMERTPNDEKLQYLMQYRWSSLPGFLNRRKKEWYIDYGMVLAEYGGDTDKARRVYRKRIAAELAEGVEVKESILGQSILGGEAFVDWVTDKYLKGEKDRERPSIKELHRHRSKDDILKVITKETGKSLDDIKRGKGMLRQITMELLYRIGAVKGEEIGRLMAVGYTSVSQERRRLHERMNKDKKLTSLMNRLESKCND
jgi:REP element-mobilizing transposase RayT